MKKVLSILSIATASLLTAELSVAQQNIQLMGMVVKANGKKLTKKPLYIEKILKNRLWYRVNKVNVNIENVAVDAQQAIYVARPKDYIEAVELFENRQYELALAAFQEVKKKYADFTDISNSFPALAGLYELECYRKLRQYDKLADAEKVFFLGKWLTKESHKQQIKIYKLWTMLRDKESYPRIVSEYKSDWQKVKLANSLRAQVEFIYGKAQEGLGETGEALIAYCKAMNADFAGSEVLTLEAVEATFNLIENDKESQEVREFWDKGDKVLMKPKVNTMPYNRLLEACGMVKVHNKLALSGYDEEGNMIKLPERFTKYLKYTKEAGEKFLEE